ncbi:MAG: DUF5615 family PIN-like protein [Chloroflexota bacterium]|nr:DUF5615 family PIN-like protein [Chloroflexota bacterium]
MFLIIDENVDDAVGHHLQERGHRVGFVRGLFASGIADTIISDIGDEDSAIVVTHDRDFKILAQRASEDNRQRFRRLGQISLRCRETQAKRGLEGLIESVEFAMLTQTHERYLLKAIAG